MGQDPYDESGGFTPYQPSDQPQDEPAGEPSVSGPPAPPYVPYGTAHHGTPSAPFVAATSSRSWVGWLVGFGVLIVTCGGIITGIAGFVADLGDSDPDTSPEVVAPEITFPSFSIPTFALPSVDIPTESTGTEIFANDLRRGQCLLGAGFDPSSNDGISDLEVTECAGAHNAQVLEVRVLSAREASDYDFADEDQGNRSCFPLFSRAQKELFRGDRYTLLSFTERATPAAGDKVACLVVRSDGALYRGFLPR